MVPPSITPSFVCDVLCVSSSAISKMLIAQNTNKCKRDLPSTTTQRNITSHFLIWCSNIFTWNRLQIANYTLRHTNAYNNSVTWCNIINVKHIMNILTIITPFVNMIFVHSSTKKNKALHITRSFNYNINKITFSHAITSTTHAFLHNFVAVRLTNTKKVHAYTNLNEVITTSCKSPWSSRELSSHICRFALEKWCWHGYNQPWEGPVTLVLSGRMNLM